MLIKAPQYATLSENHYSRFVLQMPIIEKAPTSTAVIIEPYFTETRETKILVGPAAPQ